MKAETLGNHSETLK